MRNKLLCGVAAVAIATGIGGPAMAADMALKTPPAPTPSAAPSWAGFYMGATLGYGWTKWQGAASSPTFFDMKLNGGLVGVHSGYNLQSGPWVYGIEGDYSGVIGRSWSKTVFVDEGGAADQNTEAHGEVNGLASIRARLGWAFDRTLIYATGGVGWVMYKTAAQASEGLPPPTSHTAAVGVLGGGIEWRYNPNLSFRLEGMNYFLNKTEPATTSEPGGGVRVGNIAVIRFGASYHF